MYSHLPQLKSNSTTAMRTAMQINPKHASERFGNMVNNAVFTLDQKVNVTISANNRAITNDNRF
jgi:hypothetical protein